jgi:predicted permease
MINAILPIFLLIVMGYTMRHYQLMSEAFWNDAEKLVYYVLFPAMLVSKMSVADLSDTDAIPLISALCLGMAIIGLITLLIKPLLKVENPSFSSVFQGTTRFNTFICLSLAENLFGNSGLITAVIITAILIPALNFLVVIVLHRYGTRHGPANFMAVLKQIIKNPLIIGCVVGIGLNLSNFHLPSPVQITISLMGSTALPIGLMAVGAALIVKDLKSVLRPLLTASALKLLIYPVIAFGITVAFGFDRQTQIIILIFAASPTAPASYILAKNMGGAHSLMSRIITFQTIFSSLSFFVLFWILGI